MKKLLFLLIFTLLLTGCAPQPAPERTGVTVTDAFGNTAVLQKDCRVVCAQASFAQCCVLSGITPVGVTDDAVDRGLKLPDAAVIGTTKSIDLELVSSLSPDYVVLSADLTAHLELENSLKQLGIPYGFFREDTFDDYKSMMAQFCAVSGREDLYGKNVATVEENIASILSHIPETDGRTALLLRAYSSGARAKSHDILAGQILKQYHIQNLADKYPSLLEDMSLETIVQEDPDFIFVVTMGDEAAAREHLTAHVETDPAWQSLTAVREGRYIILPQNLFHHKPNNKWDESYAYLAKILYPDIFA